MIDQDHIDSLVAEIVTNLRFRTASPAEGASALALAVYLFWQHVQTDGDLSGFMKEFAGDVLALHFCNDIKGTA